jgi:hypothetical protein
MHIHFVFSVANIDLRNACGCRAERSAEGGRGAHGAGGSGGGVRGDAPGVRGCALAIGGREWPRTSPPGAGRFGRFGNGGGSGGGRGAQGRKAGADAPEARPHVFVLACMRRCSACASALAKRRSATALVRAE